MVYLRDLSWDQSCSLIQSPSASLPIVEYCSVVWDPSTATLKAKLERVQNLQLSSWLPRPRCLSSAYENNCRLCTERGGARKWLTTRDRGVAAIYVSRWGHCTSRSAMTVLEGRVARGGCLARLPLLCSFFRRCENQPNSAGYFKWTVGSAGVRYTRVYKKLKAVHVFGRCVY